MENEIKVGEYVRTPEQGFIGKLVEINNDVLNYYKIDVKREIRRTNGMSDNYIYARDGFGLKHSPKLIDLIEVGDYVNGWKVLSIATTLDKPNEIGFKFLGFDNLLYEIDIKTIVTKEMMESISYKVKQEEK